MKLFDALPSGNCYKIRLLLAHLGRDYERIEVDVTSGTPRPDQLTELNVSGRVPLLILDDGTAMAESNAILFYLASGTPFLPSSVYDQAQVLRWMFFEQNLHEPNIAVVRHWKHCGKGGEPFRRPIELRTTAGHAALATMERHLGGRGTSGPREFFCDGFSIADIALYAYTHVAPEGGFELERYPGIQAWLDRVAAQPGHRPISD